MNTQRENWQRVLADAARAESPQYQASIAHYYTGPGGHRDAIAAAARAHGWEVQARGIPVSGMVDYRKPGKLVNVTYEPRRPRRGGYPGHGPGHRVQRGGAWQVAAQGPPRRRHRGRRHRAAGRGVSPVCELAPRAPPVPVSPPSPGTRSVPSA